MPRDAADREDLMVEATALRDRVEIRLPGTATDPEPVVVAGFREDAVLSLYFDADPFYQFDPAGRLRRALVDGDLFRAQGSALARLRRVANAGGVTLERRDLSEPELEQFFGRMREKVEAVRDALASGPAAVVRRTTEDERLLPRLTACVNQALSNCGALASSINRYR